MSNTDSALQSARLLLAPWAEGAQTPEPNRLDVAIEPFDLPAVAATLAEAGWGYLTAITGLDLGDAAEAIEVLYHFCSGAAVLTLRVRTPRASPSMPSICQTVPSASFFERELSEMFGVVVAGTPSPERLFLPDDWPEGVYPLRKDFDLKTENATSSVDT
jgi:Ni,Fe-hydrogenase III component G